jgi:hypothetical protein
LVPIDVEDDVHPGNQGIATDGGDEILYFDQLVVGQLYWLCIQNANAQPGICNLTLGYLKGSQPDIGPYTNYTGVYNNNCSNFKAAYRPNAYQYTVKRHADNNLSSAVNWSYTIPNTGTTASTVCQLGRILPANLSGTQQTFYVSVDVQYNMKDAFGNVENIYGRPNLLLPVGLNSEADLFVRSTDQCPVNKSISGAIATNRSVCGTGQYNWNFTLVYPQAGLPINLNGSMGGSRIMNMAAVTGMANGQRYDVKVRSKHVDGISITQYGSTKCVKTLGAAGMDLEASEPMSIISSASSQIALYPNPNNGNSVWVNIQGMEGTLKMELLDAMGRLLQSTTAISEGSITKEINFTQPLSSGLYELRVNNGKESKSVRMIVGR